MALGCDLTRGLSHSVVEVIRAGVVELSISLVGVIFRIESKGTYGVRNIPEGVVLRSKRLPRGVILRSHELCEGVILGISNARTYECEGVIFSWVCYTPYSHVAWEALSSI